MLFLEKIFPCLFLFCLYMVSDLLLVIYSMYVWKKKMSAFSLLHQKPNITSQDIEDNFDGNMCRCTGYRSILDAMKSFAADASIPGAKTIDIEVSTVTSVTKLSFICSLCLKLRGFDNHALRLCTASGFLYAGLYSGFFFKRCLVRQLRYFFFGLLLFLFFSNIILLQNKK